jgi:histidyl-tRNA synthetase
MGVNQFQAVRGMNDVFSPDTLLWRQVEEVLIKSIKQHAYQEIKLPFLESTALYKRSIGEVTDIVLKEMYTFTDLNGDSLSLRPEGTAGVVRAAIEHGLLRQSQKLWYFGPMFRHEKPQKGRYRQFHQLGVEVFGIPGTAIELEMLAMMHLFWSRLGIVDKLSLQINYLGTLIERETYKKDLVFYFEQHKEHLTESELFRLQRNPLRLLDSKSDVIKTLLSQAPRLIDYISPDSKEAFQELCQGLKTLEIPYEINPYLVRGLDYYNQLVFEWVSSDLGSQSTVCAGGRYDELVPQLGGPPTSAIGFALGFERLLLLLGDKNPKDRIDVYILSQETSPWAQTLLLAKYIREQTDLSVDMSYVSSSLKSQFKKADRSGAKYALILGDSELQNQEVSVKLLRQGEVCDKQFTLPRTEAISWLKKHQEV